MNKKFWIVVVMLIWAILTYNAFILIIQNTNTQSYVARVLDKERVSYGGIWNTHKYLIYTVDENGAYHVFENTDSIPHQKFDSSDFYARIETGKTYTFKVVGHRLKHFSMYKNIIEIST